MYIMLTNMRYPDTKEKSQCRKPKEEIPCVFKI
jgi:hypothetical protein